MATQRSTLALVQAASDIDQAPGTGREATKAETAADPHQRRLGSALSPFLTPFIPIQHRDERRNSWSASDGLSLRSERIAARTALRPRGTPIISNNPRSVGCTRRRQCSNGSSARHKAGGLSLCSEAALRMYAARTAPLRSERAARPGTTINPYPLHSIAVLHQAMASCCSVQARTSA